MIPLHALITVTGNDPSGRRVGLYDDATQPTRPIANRGDCFSPAAQQRLWHDDMGRWWLERPPRDHPSATRLAAGLVLPPKMVAIVSAEARVAVKGPLPVGDAGELLAGLVGILATADGANDLSATRLAFQKPHVRSVQFSLQGDTGPCVELHLGGLANRWYSFVHAECRNGFGDSFDLPNPPTEGAPLGELVDGWFGWVYAVAAYEAATR